MVSEFSTPLSLADLGWDDHFADQITDETRDLTPLRLTEVQRDLLLALGQAGAVSLLPKDLAKTYAVGDWVLSDGTHAVQRLAPKTDLSRKASGHVLEKQRIAANLDTIAIVTSCNADFNLARVERYLAMILASGARALVLITKADLVDDPLPYLEQAQALSPLVTAVALDATDMASADVLAQWCRDGQTLALVGSSGVGKTTLRNRLTEDQAATQDIREDDARGRHTTTHRSMVRTRLGGWLVDTPGMRELALADASDGILALFRDIEELATQCKFSDCAHESEPGCAVKAALESGELDEARLERWEKLREEDAHNSETLVQTKARARELEKTYRQGRQQGRFKRRGGR